MARGRPSKKAHIIDAACGLFSKQGYQSTSIDQVVLAAEVSKPTVYSNFPTKLVLWETVLESLIEHAKKDMNACLCCLEEGNDSIFTKGWVSLWQTWVGKPERLAVYRVLLGEQHKMEASTRVLFDQFETVLEAILKRWVKDCHVSQDSFFLLKAISKEALLMPVLLNQTRMSSEQLSLLVEKVIATKE
ncbi:TetR/AcrR family transcriptional regulator [Marinomonas sp. 5E14-1]|uniref:TetR/AcrR family transcriptional regulator n=1 Tax=Marinomonas sp. 5E14-1 TaxID=3153922 RepID=UPI003264AAE9